MPDVRDFLPIYAETLARVRARMDADANAGLTVDDAAWIDTREGSFYWDMTQVSALEIARLWDALGSETVAAAFPSTAWGDYLDAHAATFGLTRNPAQQSEGTVAFIGTPGTLVASGVRVAAPPSDPSFDELVFQTTQSGTLPAYINPPTLPSATPGGTGGTLPAGTYIYRVTAYNQYGETTVSSDASATNTLGQKNTVSWTAPAGTILGYRVYRCTSSPNPGLRIADVPVGTTSFVDAGTVAPGVAQPGQNFTSGVTLTVIALSAGAAGNLPANSVTDLQTLLTGIATVTNPSEMDGGADVEDDEALRERILAQYAGQSVGTVPWYVGQALAVTGIERAVCIPVWNGAGTVLVIPMLEDGSPVSSSLVSSLQIDLDPTPGLGHGEAPIGHTVTVETTTALNVTIVAAITFASGYSLDGASGTVPTRTEIVAALTDYVEALNPGDTLRYARVQSEFFTVDGVLALTGLTVNGGTSDVPLAITPNPQYAALLTPTLT